MKILQAQSDHQYQTPQNETMYVQEVLFDDNVSALVSAKSINKWQPGQQVMVKNEWTDKKGKLRRSIADEQAQQKYEQKQAVQGKRDVRVGRQWAINTAINYLQLVTTAQGQMNYNEIAHVARMFDKMRDEFDTFKLADGEDLPF